MEHKLWKYRRDTVSLNYILYIYNTRTTAIYSYDKCYMHYERIRKSLCSKKN